MCYCITVRCDANRDLIFSLQKPGGTKNASRVERSTTQSPATLTVIQKKRSSIFLRSVYSRIKKKCKQRSSSFISCLGRHDWKRAKDINVGSTVSSFDTIFCRHDLIFWWVKKKSAISPPKVRLSATYPKRNSNHLHGLHSFSSPPRPLSPIQY